MKRRTYCFLAALICANLFSCVSEEITLNQTTKVAQTEPTINRASGNNADNNYNSNQVIIRFDENYPDYKKDAIRNLYADELDFDLNFIEVSPWDNRLELWSVSKGDGSSDIDVNDLVTSMKTKDFDEGDLEEGLNLGITLKRDHDFIPSTSSDMISRLSVAGGPIIAILDSGLDYGIVEGNYLYDSSNPDNPDEISGWDFIDNDADVRDDFGHGTHITKIILDELKHYNVRAKILPLKAFGDQGQANMFDLVNALAYINAHDEIDIVNMSLGWIGDAKKYAILEEIIDEVAEHTLIVSSAGNNGQNTDVQNHLPSGFSNPKILCVGGFQTLIDGEAVINNGSVTGITVADYSNFGNKGVDVCAPFGGYYIKYQNDPPFLLEGTSFSTALVTAKAAIEHKENQSFKAWKHNILRAGFNSSHLKPYFGLGLTYLPNEQP